MKPGLIVLPAERALLGAVISDSQVLAGCSVTAEDFYRPEHGELFRLLREMDANGDSIDLVTVGTRVQRHPERYGGAAYVAELPECAPSSTNAPAYAREVRNAAVRRAALEQLEQLGRALRGEGVGPHDPEGAADAVRRAAELLEGPDAGRGPGSSLGARRRVHLPAERALLGAAICDSQVLAGCSVRAEDFYRPEHGELFRLLREMDGKGEPINLDTVRTRVQRHPDRYGGAAYVAELHERIARALRADGGDPDLEAENAEDLVRTRLPQSAAEQAKAYAREVREAAVLRAALERHERIGRALRGDKVGPELEAENAEDLVRRAAFVLEGPDTGSHGARRIRTLGEVWDEMQARGGEPDLVWPTDLLELDRMLGGGLRPGQLVVVGGGTSMGKSALALSIAMGCGWHRARSLLVSAEMSAQELANRSLSYLSCVPLSRVKQPKTLTPADARTLAAWKRDTHRDLVTLVDWGRVSADDVVTAVRREARRGAGPQVVVVDYLQILERDPRRSMREEMARFCGMFKGLARELGIAVVALSQLNREGQKEPPRKGAALTGDWTDRIRLPSTTDLAESSSIENDADVVMFPVRADKSGPSRRTLERTAPHDAVIVVAKQRNGPTGTVAAYWDGPCACYRSGPPLTPDGDAE